MAAYVCEFEAKAWRDRGRPDVAAAFKEAALRATLACERYVREKPLRFIKNAFPPPTRHGRDAAYGEYAIYALLAASLFARAARVADDSIPTARAGPALASRIVHLRTAFHKIFATCRDTQVEIDTCAQPGQDATGLGRFHCRNVPPELGLCMGIAADPRYIVHGAMSDRSVTIGPCWQTSAGGWQSLAEMSGQIESVTVTERKATADEAEWTVEWALASESRVPVTAVRQHFRLTDRQIEIQASVQGVLQRLGFEVPCLVTAGGARSEIHALPAEVTVSYEGWTLRAAADEAVRCVLEDGVRANR